MKRNNTIYAITIMALMIAIMFIMGFTPLGTFQAGVLTITLLGIPVAICACVFGPYMGLIAGTIWGLISLIQGLTGYDASGPILMEYSAIGLVVTCLLPRMITGFLAGVIYDANRIWDKKGRWSSVIASLSVSILNTVLFMTSYCLFFFSSPSVQAGVSSMVDKYGSIASNPFIYVALAIGINFIVEVLVNGIVGSACVFGINLAAEKLSVKSPFPLFFQKKEKKVTEETPAKEEK